METKDPSPERTLIKELTPETLRARLRFKILEPLVLARLVPSHTTDSQPESVPQSTKEVKDGSRCDMLLIGDESAIAVLQLTGTHTFEPETWIEMDNVRVSMSHGFMRVTSSPFSAKVIDDAGLKDVEIQFGVNVSDVEYEYRPRQL
jgi:hypothetical protein